MRVCWICFMYAFCGVSNVFTTYVLCVHGVYSCAWCGRMVYTFGDMCYVMCACGLCDCVVSCVYCRFYVIYMCVRSRVFCRMCVAVVMHVDGVCALCFLLCCVLGHYRSHLRWCFCAGCVYYMGLHGWWLPCACYTSMLHERPPVLGVRCMLSQVLPWRTYVLSQWHACVL